MAADNRDWYRGWWRKKTGYVERASFRISEGERAKQKFNADWRRNWLILAGVVAAIAAAIIAKRL